MGRLSIGVALRDCLGDEATGDLVEYVETRGDRLKADLLSLHEDRLEPRLRGLVSSEQFEASMKNLATNETLIQSLSDVRQELAAGLAALRVEAAAARSDVVRWSFVFWIGQMATIIGLMAWLRMALR
jgi:hypothetical protein